MDIEHLDMYLDYNRNFVDHRPLPPWSCLTSAIIMTSEVLAIWRLPDDHVEVGAPHQKWVMV